VFHLDSRNLLKQCTFDSEAMGDLGKGERSWLCKLSKSMSSAESGLDPDEYICHQKQGNLVEIEEPATGERQTVLSFCTR